MNDALQTALADLVPHLVSSSGSSADDHAVTAEKAYRCATAHLLLQDDELRVRVQRRSTGLLSASQVALDQG